MAVTQETPENPARDTGVGTLLAHEPQPASHRCGDWIQTFTGREFWPLDPRESEIDIEDIAHALSNQCRFSGHVSDFYSVAEHCVRVANCLPLPFKAWGLLHDATEAYLVDLPRPLKQYTELGSHYRRIENNLMRCIARRFDLSEIEPEQVKYADSVLLATEKRDLMGPCVKPWEGLPEPLEARIVARPPAVAKREFLKAFHDLRQRSLLCGVWRAQC